LGIDVGFISAAMNARANSERNGRRHKDSRYDPTMHDADGRHPAGEVAPALPAAKFRSQGESLD
jgi:hypothetical protein